MYPLLVSLYEFGQFLRILLWISVPLVVLSMLVTTWLHYRRKRRDPEEYLLSLDGGDGISIPILRLSSTEMSGNGQESLHADDGAAGEEEDWGPDQKENIYKGILWMKEKYEQYRDMADRRYEQLREELARTEKKYQDLLEAGGRPAANTGATAAAANLSAAEFAGAASSSAAASLAASTAAGPGAGEPVPDPLSDVDQASYPDLLEEKNRQIAFLQQQLDQRIKNFHQAELNGRENKGRMLELEELQLRTRHLLEEKQAYIDQLEGELVAERQKIEELVAKLQASSQQLLTIYEELDRSLKPTGAPGEPLSSPSEP
ncbi:MAG TPA: hypothetical protein VKQ52_05980 [Puia sp.]|nr:hypothetical protein [Puia sp.]